MDPQLYKVDFSDFKTLLETCPNSLETKNMMKIYNNLHRTTLSLINNSAKNPSFCFSFTEDFFFYVLYPFYKYIKAIKLKKDYVLTIIEQGIKLFENMRNVLAEENIREKCALHMRLGDLHRYIGTEESLSSSLQCYKTALKFDCDSTSPYCKLGFYYFLTNDTITALFYYILSSQCVNSTEESAGPMNILLEKNFNRNKNFNFLRKNRDIPIILVDKNYEILYKSESASFPYDLSSEDSILESISNFFVDIQNVIIHHINVDALPRLSSDLNNLMDILFSCGHESLLFSRMAVIWGWNVHNSAGKYSKEEMRDIVAGFSSFVEIVLNYVLHSLENEVFHHHLQFLVILMNFDAFITNKITNEKTSKLLSKIRRSLLNSYEEIMSRCRECDTKFVDYKFVRLSLGFVVEEEENMITEALFEDLMEHLLIYNEDDDFELRLVIPQPGNELSRALQFPVMNILKEKYFGNNLMVVVVDSVFLDTNIYMESANISHLKKAIENKQFSFNFMVPNIVHQELEHLSKYKDPEKRNTAKKAVRLLKNPIFQEIKCKESDSDKYSDRSRYNDNLIINCVFEREDASMESLCQEMIEAQKDVSVRIHWRSCVFVTEDKFAMFKAIKSLGLYACMFDDFRRMLLDP